VSAVARSLDREQILLRFDGGTGPMWAGRVVAACDFGPFCTQRPDGLTVWAPGDRWAHAFSMVAMCKSAAPEDCLVLTDVLPPLDQVPHDGRVAVLVNGWRGPAQPGRAVYSCADLRGDRVFRLMLDGRVRRRPRMAAVLEHHRLARTAHGRRLLDRWRQTLPVLFGAGLEGMMPDALRRDLTELQEAARHAEHAITGGFHSLDKLVRLPSEWEAGARTYLRLAATSSPALAAVDRWLDAGAGWAQAPPDRQERLRMTAARILHRLVDDPWLPESAILDLLRQEAVP
jgi:hypothetical protein